MPVYKLDPNFSSLSPSEFVLTLGTFAALLASHPFFKENWPSFLMPPQQLQVLLKEYDEAVKVAEADGGKKNLQTRDDLRKSALKAAIFMTQYIVMRADSENEPSFLTSFGLRPQNRSKKSKQAVALVASDHISAQHGDEPGTAVLSCGKVPGAGTYEFWGCYGNPEDPAAWWSLGQFKTYYRVNISGLESVRKMYFKVRCHGTGAPGPFTDYVSLVIL